MSRNTKNRRDGFTMIELLAAIAVIALMMALLTTASYRFIVSARESATATTVTKASGIIQDRVRAFREFDFSDAGTFGANNWNANNPSDQMTPQLAEVIFRKTRYKKAFPQAWAELDKTQLSRLFPDFPISNPTFPLDSSTFPATYKPKFESGIILYALLLRGETFGAPTPTDDAFTGAEIKTSAETLGLPCLVDAWGEPIRFYRWPTRLIRCGEQNFSGASGSSAFDDINQNTTQDPAGWVEASGSNSATFSPAIRPNSLFPGATPASLLISNMPPFDPASSFSKGPDLSPGNSGGSPPFSTLGFPDTDDPESLNIDPDDPSFQLSAWLFDPNATTAVTATRRAQFVVGVHDFFTFHTPLIISAGPDKQLGLFEPTDVPTTANPNSLNFGYLAAPILTPTANKSLQVLFDNITNLNQRAGGK